MFQNTLGLFASLLLTMAGASAATDTTHKAPDLQLFIAGSSAQDGALENLMRIKAGLEGTPNLCTEGSLRVYRAEIDGVRKRLFTCLSSDRVPGIPGNIRLAVHKSSGGSGEGVTPVARREEIEYIDAASLEDSACNEATHVLYTGDLAAFTDYHDCVLGTQPAVPEAGFSDIAGIDRLSRRFTQDSRELAAGLGAAGHQELMQCAAGRAGPGARRYTP